jgi:pyruvate kinase
MSVHPDPAGTLLEAVRSRRLHRTKTVATVGPASNDPKCLEEMVGAGVNVFRLNMAHGKREDHERAVSNIRGVSRKLNFPIGILVDLAGPKIRLGTVRDGARTVATGEMVTFASDEASAAVDELVCSYSRLAVDARPGDRIMIGDGIVRLQVVSADGKKVVCRVVDGGVIRTRQGVNLPGIRLALSALSSKDIEDAMWAVGIGAEFVSLSFVRQAEEVLDLKKRLREAGSQAMVVAKIEKRESLDQLDSIVEAADVVMVARGDLGVEIEIEKTPLAQKRIIDVCSRLGKPVIVATQMLESMISSRFPTRAEVSDVANAILDGADACMLSGETATGEFPVEAVRMMRRIQEETETVLRGRPSREQAMANGNGRREGDRGGITGVLDAIMLGAAMIARRADAQLVVIASSSAEAAMIKSKQRDFIPTIAVTDNSEVANRISLFWGISPVLMQSLEIHELKDHVRTWLSGEEGLHKGDRVVFVGDTWWIGGHHDTVMIWEVP